jgi:hypothetical protein
MSASRTESAKRFKNRPRREFCCPCGKCRERSGFCEPHRQLLHRLRDEFDAKLKSKGQHYQQAKNRKGGPRVSTCCNPNCWEPRTPPNAFCVACIDAGWVQEAD